MASGLPVGRFHVVATLVAKGPQEAEELANILTKVAKRADSEEEPNCFLYRPVRQIDDPLTFVVFEEYENDEAGSATLVHRQGKDFQELIQKKDQLFSKFEVKFFKALL
ncbi:hypothetical protein IE53DRAFT_389460 [Violaceomyces palustris]|uniref:Uncharacterized protein n=1 Tax=Violaceomyces palustris TaxID=1673888 RepID=A0ACD0NR70_9BASI|nr:hypothetical protein IE53DRAFT_389460 [Violaceomyces palustris]